MTKTKWKSRFGGWIRPFIPIDSKIGVRSMAGAMVCAALSAVVCYMLFSGRLQQYTDLVAGDIIMDGLNKIVEFWAYGTFVAVYLMAFFAGCYFQNKKTNAQIIRSNYPNGIYALAASFPIILMALLRVQQLGFFSLTFILFLVGSVFLLYHRMQKKDLLGFALSSFYIYLSLAGILALFSFILPKYADDLGRLFPFVLWMVLCAGLVAAIRISTQEQQEQSMLMGRFCRASQVFVPLVLFCLISTRYIYQDTSVEQSQLTLFRIIVSSLSAVLVMANIYPFLIKAKGKAPALAEYITLSTLLCFSVAAVWTGYSLIVNPDAFHTGETEVIYHQIIDLGQRWGTDFISVLQGLGFISSALNAWIFGGTYATYAISQMLLLTICTALTVAGLYYIVEHKWLLLLWAPILPLPWMNRTYLVAIVYIILLNPKLIRKPALWTYAYIATCIAHVWYQPTYGGAVAASLLPALFFIWYREAKDGHILPLKDKRDKVRKLLFCGSIALIGLCCIPMLLHIMRYLKMQGESSITANSYTIMQFIHNPPFAFTKYPKIDSCLLMLFKFGTGPLFFIISTYFFVRYVIVQKDMVKLTQGIILTVSCTIAFFILMPAILTRIDPGLSRIGIASIIFFSVLLPLFMYLYRKEIGNRMLGALLFGFALSVPLYLITPSHLTIHEKASRVNILPSEVMYVTPDETGLKKLGSTFIGNPQYLSDAMILNEVVQSLLSPDQTYYDLANKSIYYEFVNKPVPGLYVLSSIAYNRDLQDAVIQNLEKYDIPLVYINGPLRGFGVNQSLRSYRIYRYWMLQDFEHVRYKGCDFMIRKDIDLTPIQGGIGGPNNTDFKAYAIPETMAFSARNPDSFNDIVSDGGSLYHTTGKDPFLIYHTQTDAKLDEMAMFEIKFGKKLPNGIQGQLFVATPSVAFNEKNSMRFEINSNTVLIPLDKAPELQLEGGLTSVRLDFNGMQLESPINVEEINLYHLSGKQKSRFELQVRLQETIPETPETSLNDLFDVEDLMKLPNQWGANYKNLQEELLFISDLSVAEKKAMPERITYTLKTQDPLPGSQADYLYLKLQGSPDENCRIRINATGLDRKGNRFEKTAIFDGIGDTFLVPLGISPDYLQAQRIDKWELTFYDQITELPIEAARLYTIAP